MSSLVEPLSPADAALMGTAAHAARTGSSLRSQRSDARRNRAAILRAAAGSSGGDLTMQAVAAAAGVSRSTVHRHFPSRPELERALRSEALSAAERIAQDAASGDGSALARLRRLVDALVAAGSDHGAGALDLSSDGAALEGIGAALAPLADELSHAASLAPRLPRDFIEKAGAQLLHACLEIGGSQPDDPAATSETLLRSLTDPLDRGLVILDRTGSLLALNPPAAALLSPGSEQGAGERLTAPRVEAVYEDGGPCPGGAYPLAAAVRTGEEQPLTIRGHVEPGGTTRWVRVEASVLRRVGSGSVYGVVGALSDVTRETEWERRLLRAPGQLGSAGGVPLDIARILDEIPPHLLPDQFVSEARRVTGTPVALYMLDIDGSHLLRLAGAEELPARLDAPLALGPELARDGIPDLRTRLEADLPGAVMAPMWLRGRAIGVLLSAGSSEAGLEELARHGAAAMELADGYTDVFDQARRRKATTPAAELQQSLLPPRIARLGTGELAGSVLPSYEVGGDWFDYVENPDGAWIAIADAAGKGTSASALGGVALAGLRAARRSGRSLEEAAQGMHEAVHDVDAPEFFVTAMVARWHSVHSSFSWITCGHPPPLVVRADDTIEQLVRPAALPLGLLERKRRFTRHQRRLEVGERLILHSDGVTARRTADGQFGLEGVERAVREASTRSAPAIARAIQEAVMNASVDPLQDDAVVVVLAPDGVGASGS
ncbi:MAG TPA: SpoIIE family protein phosphatase [Thermoleophilaceae bacterium]|nr:SpoIIE family protein phosphatase [Thermoleophilaceae bacterium]